MVRRFTFALLLAATPLAAQEALTPDDLVMFFVDSVLGTGKGLCVGTQQNCIANGEPKSRDMLVTFEFNSSTLTADAKATLDVYADAILDERLEQLRFSVEGHTDGRGDDRYNLGLSEARAESVRAFLIGKGVAPDRLIATGYGETKPITGNILDPENRRVEMRVKLN